MPDTKKLTKEEYKNVREKQRQREYEFTDSCKVCKKASWRRDSDYSNYKFNGSYCAKCCPQADIYGNDVTMLKNEDNKEEQEKFLKTNQLANIPF